MRLFNMTFRERMWWLTRLAMAIVMLAALLLGAIGCAGNQAAVPGGPAKVAGAVAQVAADAPQLARQLDAVYEFWAAQKALPDKRDLATQILQKLDEIAPTVQAGATALSQPGKLGWCQAAIQVALATAQILGFVAPLL
ncbi:MAG: hypothetical protein M1438_19945 [Deltaproteobacteria bacterium]|nr:hypothetical protein [Deltaproteobacteria bacterium]